MLREVTLSEAPRAVADPNDPAGFSRSLLSARWAEAIQSATVTAARLIGKEDQLGSISQGKLADIVALEGNPLEDISLLSEINFVMKDGRIYRQPQK